MNFKNFFLVFIFLIVFSSIVFSGYIDISYSYFRTDSFPSYLTNQYAYYNDNVSFRYGINAYGYNNNVPVRVSPVIYGVNPYGIREFVYSVPSQVVYVSPYNTFDYVYDNLFYFDNDYDSYELELNASTLDNSSIDTKTSNVYYYDQTTQTYNNSTSTQTQSFSCNDVLLSGKLDIYLDEDDHSSYSLYVNNDSIEDIQLDSVTTNNPNELDVDHIDYPFYINSKNNKIINLDLETDTVSSDYSNNLEIYVDYSLKSDPTTTCYDYFTLTYHIENQDLDSDADCSDLKLDNLFFEMDTKSNKTFDIKVINESYDYDFLISDIDLDLDNDLDYDLKNYDDVKRDDYDYVSIKFFSDDIDTKTTKYIDIEVEGEMVRDNRKDKTCRINDTIKLDIKNPEIYNSQNDICNQININTLPIILKENQSKSFNKDNGFYIQNNSDYKFQIDNLIVSDNQKYSSVLQNPISSYIDSKKDLSLDFRLDSKNIDSLKQSTGRISLSGSFSNGISCYYNDVYSEFDYKILDDKDLCSNLFLEKENNSNLKLINNNDFDFYVNDFLITNHKEINTNVFTKSKQVNSNSSENIEYGTNGIGYSQIFYKGEFENGESCDYYDVVPAYILNDSTNNQLNFSSSCDYDMQVVNSLIVDGDRKSLSFNFKNNSDKKGYIEVYGIGVLVDKSVFYFNEFEEINQTINISNYDDAKKIIYKVNINDCKDKEYFTYLTENIPAYKKIYFRSFPSTISSYDSKLQTSVNIYNDYLVDKDLKVKLTGFDSSFEIYTQRENYNIFNNLYNFKIDSKDSKSLDFVIDSLNNYGTYKGYFEIYDKDKLISKTPIILDYKSRVNDITYNYQIEEIDLKKYKLLLNIKNNSDEDLKNIQVDLNSQNLDSVNGEKSIAVLKNQEKILEYELIFNKLDKDQKVDLKISSKDDIYSETLSIGNDDKINSFFTGFFTFNESSSLIIGLIVLVILFLIIYYSAKRTKHIYPKNKQESFVLENRDF